MLSRLILLFVLFVVIARLFWRFVDGVIRGASGGAEPGRRAGGPVPVKMLPCPVCGTYVVPGKAISGVSGGAQVYFCSEACRSKYESR